MMKCKVGARARGVFLVRSKEKHTTPLLAVAAHCQPAALLPYKKETHPVLNVVDVLYLSCLSCIKSCNFILTLWVGHFWQLFLILPRYSAIKKNINICLCGSIFFSTAETESFEFTQTVLD